MFLSSTTGELAEAKKIQDPVVGEVSMLSGTGVSLCEQETRLPSLRIPTVGVPEQGTSVRRRVGARGIDHSSSGEVWLTGRGSQLIVPCVCTPLLLNKRK